MPPVLAAKLDHLDRQGLLEWSAKKVKLARRGHIPVGYYNDPDKTARTFVEIDGERWAFPGDLATVEADGTINLLGRGSSPPHVRCGTSRADP